MAEREWRWSLVCREVAAVEPGFYKRGDLALIGDLVGDEREVIEERRVEERRHQRGCDNRGCRDDQEAETNAGSARPEQRNTWSSAAGHAMGRRHYRRMARVAQALVSLVSHVET